MSLRNFFVSVLVFTSILSCKKTPAETDKLFKFKDYINYTTSGRVSILSPINIGLVKDIEGWVSNDEILDNIVSISPKVKGVLIVKNPKTMAFIPNKPLKPDTEYTVTVKLNELQTNIPSEFKNYTFRFKTIKPNFNIITQGLQSYNKEWQYLEGIIKLADATKLDDAKMLVVASQKGSDLPIKWDKSNDISTYFEFKIDSISRQINDSEVKIIWNGKSINSSNKGENTITIPGINNFTIVDVSVIQSPEQYLSINFSDRLKKQQNFDGLVTIQNVKTPKFIVSGNVLKIYPDTQIVGNMQVDVFQGIKNTEGFKLKQSFSELVSFEELKPQVRLITGAGILPNSQDLKFNFEAVNLKAVDVRIIKIFENNVLQFLQDNNLGNNYEYNIRRVGRRIAKKTIPLIKNDIENTGKWKAYSIDLSTYFKADPGAIYRVELSYKKAFSLYDCNANNTSIDSDDESYFQDDYSYTNAEENYSEDEELREEEYWDNVNYGYRNYTYNWRERDNPCHEAYYNEDRIVSSNLIASNLGIIAKRGNNKSYYFTVTDILTTNPIANATVELFNYQQQSIKKATTDREGLTIIDADNQAYFAIVTKGKETSYIKLSDGNALSMSKFNVSGKTLQRGLKGFIYGERGVWRPGDTLHLTFMLNDNANPLPVGHPVKMEITDANGKLTYRKVKVNGVNNFYRFSVPTSPEDNTGNWNAKVSVGGASFYKTLKVETVKPNRLKIKIDFEDEILSNAKPLQSKLNVNWLHGAPAKNIKAEIKAKFYSTTTGFKNYPNYIFNDPTRKFETEEITIFDGKVNTEGIANVNKKINIGNNTPGMLNVSFLTRAFENGGDFSIDVFSKKYAPYDAFVGLKSPQERAYGSFYTDEDQEFKLVVVDAKGKPIQRNNLEIKVYQIQWRWWWSSSYDDLASYQSSSYHIPFLNTKVNTNNNGEATFKINVPDAESGRYLIRVYDPESGHATGRTAYFYRNWWHRDSENTKDAAKMLVFSSDKEVYNVGDMAKITFPSGTEGRALVSIENGTEVLATSWVKTQKGETTTSIPITKEMTPNVFVNISLLQPHAVTENDLPIRLYGIIPIMVEDKNTVLEPQISMPNVLRPEQDITIKISEKNNKAMTYTVAIVDDGLLDLTRFKTPNGWDVFYAREALGVKTWDIFDEVVGAYTGSVDQIFEIGGDGNATVGKKKKANRFKPVVKYIGPFELEAGETKSHSIKIPKYIGSVRTMVVSGDNINAAYGSVEKTTPVKKPLMVLATLPRKLSPGEKVTLPVTVFAMEDKIKTVSINLKLSKGISVVGKKTQTLSFTKPDEQMTYFELDVSKAKGINTVEVIASGHGETSSYEVELDVVNPNPYSSKVTDLILDSNTSKTIDFATFGVEGSNSASIEFSTMPPMNFTGRLQYLIRYPHGCVEQTTSSVFPQLYLTDIFDLTLDKKQTIENNIKNGIKKLANFQRPNGGLSYWSGQHNVNDWGTTYAGHFMIEAEKKGYVLPLTFKTNWLQYQKQAAKDWRPSYKNYRSDVAQAYRLYTLALAGHPDLGAMNRLKEFGNLSNDAKWRLAAAYSLAGQAEAAKAISATANTEFGSRQNDYYTYGSVDRNRAMALETMVILNDTKTRHLAEYIAKRLSSKQWMSTQSTAYSLLAMAKMVNKNGGKALHLNYTLNADKSELIETNNAISQRTLNIKDGSNKIEVNNTKNNTIYARIVTSGKLPLGKEIIAQRGLKVSITYKDSQGNAIDITKLKQGQDFAANITVVNQKNEPINDVALTQIFPSGWEIVNTRFTDFGNATTNQADYTDIRDDRVNFYFNLSKSSKTGSTKTFNVLLNASYLGKYYLPGTQVEAMYDNDYFVRTKGQWIEVNK
ncbi:alpha-2-macroglobulin domain-containing protein [hydrothermal vent metagenome]|uniref:Alpha-2-macroglobulin domain-containing protein n=1 Tax=hydrothermal vent metagenome TaxID=652676 RepID=A0A3B0QRB6_9ZZZZ